MNAGSSVRVRDATVADAEEACDVLRRSIAELCAADHRADADRLTAWLANKNVVEFAAWLAIGDNNVLVATDGRHILAVGSVRDAGEITLNYVSPDFRFQGVSTIMLDALERRAAARGAKTLTLTSTHTAHAFYLSRGYRDLGVKSGGWLRMTKAAPLSAA